MSVSHAAKYVCLGRVGWPEAQVNTVREQRIEFDVSVVSRISLNECWLQSSQMDRENLIKGELLPPV